MLSAPAPFFYCSGKKLLAYALPECMHQVIPKPVATGLTWKSALFIKVTLLGLAFVVKEE